MNTNDQSLWNKIWQSEGVTTWRGSALESVYNRISDLIPPRSRVVDLGGGVGLLAKKLQEEKLCTVEVWDHSSVAVETCIANGVPARVVDLTAEWPETPEGTYFVSTEFIEHVPEDVRTKILKNLKASGLPCFLSVPNDRLGPDEEPQHHVKFTALEYKRELQKYFKDVRVECLGPPAQLPKAQFPSDRGQPLYLLGVCGIPKGFTMSMTMPVRDEAVDIEATLASFMAVSDEMVIGVDPRTVDQTREIARKYADVVFDLVDPQGIGEERVPEAGVHFAWVRNQCMDKCTGDWIFMTEGHERLGAGVDTLLALEKVVPAEAKICLVLRTAQTLPGHWEQWGFPWLCRSAPGYRYKRSTHNVLDYPEKAYVIAVPQVRTIHERVHSRSMERARQRASQNRIELTRDWLVNGNDNSLYYLGTEWREFNSEKALKYLREFLAINRNNGPMRYQTRLVLAKMLANINELEEARAVLIEAVKDDWTRTDHWVWLGDIAMHRDNLEEALQFYTYASTKVGSTPFTLWWIDLSYYSYAPVQRMVMVLSALGRYEEALFWAKQVEGLLPKEAPADFFEEAKTNVRLLEEAIHGFSQ